jgi:hypothetical protein
MTLDSTFPLRRCLLALLHTTSVFLAVGARAQTNACDQLKAALAARIEASGVRGYSLEAVPGSSTVPHGTSVIGTCDAGRTKILYRRWAATPPPVQFAAVPEPASAVQAVVAQPEPIRAPSGARAERAPEAASAPDPALRSEPGPAMAASAVAAPSPAPEPRRDVPAVEVVAVRVVDRAAVPPAPPPARNAATVATAPLAQRVLALLAANWRWLGALILLPIAAWAWAWQAHRSAYDAAGLPRGPKF